MRVLALGIEPAVPFPNPFLPSPLSQFLLAALFSIPLIIRWAHRCVTLSHRHRFSFFSSSFFFLFLFSNKRRGGQDSEQLFLPSNRLSVSSEPSFRDIFEKMILAVTSNRFAVSWKLLSAEVNNKIACVSVLENAPTIGRRDLCHRSWLVKGYYKYTGIWSECKVNSFKSIVSLYDILMKMIKSHVSVDLSIA